ncbi:hypothetical protein FS837_012102, partial [Tulasnella sp. UAMH 9824]
SEWLLATTIAVHGFGNDYYSAHNRVTEQDIEEVFRKYGRILHAQIWKSQRGGAWAFVTFKCIEDRDAAIHDLNGQTVDVRSRDGRRQIVWQTPLKVTAPRFHSVRFYYNQYAAVRIVPAELTFTPSAEPGQGGTFQRALGGTRRLPPTGPRHGRRLMNKIAIDTSFRTRHDRPSSPAPSNAGTSIQWGHERARTPTPEPPSPAYDSEKTFCSSGENVSPGEDDGEEMEDYDYAYDEDDEMPRSPSPLDRRQPASSPAPSTQYDDHDDSSHYPQSPRSGSEPSSQSRKRRRCDDDYVEDADPLRAEIRQLREENDRLRAELDDAQRERRDLTERADEERDIYQRRLERLIDRLCASLEYGDDGRPHKRGRTGTPPLDIRSLDDFSASALFSPTTTTSPSHIRATQRRHS